MRILLAIEYGPHPFWNRNEYELYLMDTDTLTSERIVDGQSEMYFTEQGVEAMRFANGSGYGRVPAEDKRRLIVPRDKYDVLIVHIDPRKEEARQNYEGNWRDNTDFEDGGERICREMEKKYGNRNETQSAHNEMVCDFGIENRIMFCKWYEKIYYRAYYKIFHRLP